MENEKKKLLIQDLCSRLPYGVKVNPVLVTFEKEVPTGEIRVMNALHLNTLIRDIDNKEQRYTYKPYLFPLSSMTDEQKKEYQYITERWMYDSSYSIGDSVDWLNKNHFDFRWLIEKGLAIDASGKGIY